MEEERVMIMKEGDRILLCGEADYRDKLYETFNRALLFGLVKDYMSTLKNPIEFRETIISTWRDIVCENRERQMDGIVTGIERLLAQDPDWEVPEELGEESLKEQQDFFNGILEEIECEMRAALA